jgi:sortase (surface protein transpeptidase)
MAAAVGSRGGRGVLILVTALAVVVSSGCADAGTPRSAARPESPRGAAVPLPKPTQRSPEPSRTPGTSGDVAAPERVRIPSIGVSARIVPLPIDRSGKLIAPKGFHVAGWNKAGPEPGEDGTAVIAGHVDSRDGPAVFYRLRELRRGDRIEVDRVDGGTAVFTVTKIVQHRKTAVPAEVYRPAPGPEIRLVTCGGTFDRGRGSYRDNLIVHAAER